ncbi:hypothetical protein NSK11_contig00054-0034 [Nocardia seriolae]|uniref:Uncharacterized protein n=1 Tax=Nocardia seriolae TaxID=37332 RepID=A0ABC9YV65_9NOCA|nr:hypothetical protein NSERKGN1266_43660 [Nocardia seriolae]BEK95658.1 hypothetical protein NSER024013_35640 [Nocardia seriolae]GAM47502.1 hypothetical protein NS07_v2contig00051-0034 [Nocardia seriolae]GAP29364.1 hypothetical protein NSK11_contig00054-0034 [Nocardia seriolae]GEM25032.1 hypothetical protein NS2_32710 [Nocardia seriolae NBRC 15557]
MALIRQPLPTPCLVAIGLISLLPALLTGGPIVAAVAIWYRGGGRDGWWFPLFLAVMVVIGMFASAAISLGTAWRRSRADQVTVAQRTSVAAPDPRSPASDGGIPSVPPSDHSILG